MFQANPPPTLEAPKTETNEQTSLQISSEPQVEYTQAIEDHQAKLHLISYQNFL